MNWNQKISKEIFDAKYRNSRKDVEHVFRDISKFVAKNEDKMYRTYYREKFYNIMSEGYFIPAGRILSNAWEKSPIKNYMNCFTIGVEDSIEGIASSLGEDLKISRLGGGVGFDISKLRPKNASLSRGGVSSGPVSFLKVFNEAAKIIMTGGARRAAHIALLDISHPDIEEFITIKKGDKNKELTQFNISVKITDKFIQAYKNDKDWSLKFNGKEYKKVKAKYLYDLLSENAFINNEPGIFNVDTINRYNNAYWAFKINEVNPCGEICMPAYSICCLSSINLGNLVRNKFTDEAYFDFDKFKEVIHLGVRFLDNLLDLTEYPVDKIKENSHKWRRIGLGFTALGNTFQYLRMSYGSDESMKLSRKIARMLRDESYKQSIRLSEEKGCAPGLKGNFKKLIKSNFIKKMDNDIIKDIKKYGLRNINLNTIAPNGTISLSVGQNCSSGIEPSFSLQYNRSYIVGINGEKKQQTVYDNGWLEYLKFIDPELHKKALNGEEISIDKPDFFTTTEDVDCKRSIDLQAIFQEYIDHSISKTLNLPKGTTQEEYNELFLYAYDKGLKGFTTFNPCGSMKGILEFNSPEKDEEKYIQRHHAPKRPKDLECDIHEISINGEKFIVFVGKLFGSIYEMFLMNNKDGIINVHSHKHGIIRKNSKNIYSLIIDDDVICDNIVSSMEDEYKILTRIVSMSLRHGTPLQFICDQMSKSSKISSFEKSVSRILKKYIKVGEKVLKNGTCPECGSDLVYKEGCIGCSSCGFSKCD